MKNIKLLYSNHRNILLFIIFILYITSVFIGIINHEPWRDEGNPWLIARDLNLFEIFLQTGNEGHPFLWYYILKPITLLSLPYYTGMSIVNALFTVLGVYVLLFKIKIPLWCTLVWLLFTPIFYEYPVIARSYGIAFLLCTLILYLYKQRLHYPFIYTILLGAFINTTVIASVIGIIMLLYFHYEVILYQKNNKEYSKNKFYSILCLGVFFLFLISVQIFFMFIMRGSNKLPFSKDISIIYSPIVSFIISVILFTIYFCVSKPNMHLPKPKMNNIIKVFTLLLLAFCLFRFFEQPSLLRIPTPIIIIILLYKNKFSAFIVSLMYFSMICISIFLGLSVRHTALFLFFIFVYMLYEIYEDNKKLTNIVLLVILIHIFSTNSFMFIKDFYKDIYNDYSGSYEAANYIKQEGLDNTNKYILIPLNKSLIGGVSPYFENKIFYSPNIDEYISFTDYAKNTTTENKYIHNDYDKDVIFLDDSRSSTYSTNFELITNFNGIADRISLYKLIE